MKTVLKLQVARGKFYYRMFKFFLFMLPLALIVSIFFYTNLQKTLEQEFFTDYAQISESVALKADVELEEIDQLCRMLSRSVSVAPFSQNKVNADELVRGNAITLRNYMEIINDLHITKASIGSVTIHFTVNGFFLSNTGLIWKDSFFSFNKYGRLTLLDYNRAIESMDPYTVLSPDVLSRPYGNLRNEPVVPIIYNYAKEGRKLNIQINVLRSYFQSLLKDTNPDKTAFLGIYDKTGAVVADTGGEYASSFATFAKDYAELKNGEIVDVAGTSYALFHSKARYAGWTVLAFAPRAILMERIFSVIRLMALVNGLILLLGIVMSYGLSRRLYSPIANLISLLDDSASQRQNASDELALIATRIKWLENSNRHLTGKMSRLSPYVQGNVIRNIVLYGDKSLDEAEILELFRGERVELNLKYYVMTIFRPAFTEDFHLAFPENERQKYIAGIAIMVKEVISYRFGESVFVDLNEGSFFGVINGNDPNLRGLICRFAEQIGSIFKEDAQYIKVLIYVGQNAESLKMLPNEFSAGLDALARRDIESPGYLVEFDEPAARDILLPPNLEESFQNVIESDNPTDIAELVDGFFRSAFRSGRTARTFMEAATTLYSMCRSSAERQGMDTKKELWPHFCTLMDVWDVDAVRRLFVQWIGELAGKEYTLDQDAEKRKIFQEHCIQNYMNESFSLESMATHFNLHSNYLSRRFKALMGENFKDYLLNLRMKKAVDLLQKTDMPIDTVAQNVGIASRSTFNRLFKKHSGVSPATYRMIAK